VGSGGEILEDRVLAALLAGHRVGLLGECILLEAEDGVAHVLGRQFDDSCRAGALLGGNDKSVVDDEVLVWYVAGLEFSFVDSGEKYRLDNILEDDICNFIRCRVGVERKANNPKRLGPALLVASVELVGELLDGVIFFLELRR
jgi:hypothetical protein